MSTFLFAAALLFIAIRLLGRFRRRARRTMWTAATLAAASGAGVEGWTNLTGL